MPQKPNKTEDSRRKLTPAQVEDIRYLYEQSRGITFDTGEPESVRELDHRLADEFGVSVPTIQKIVMGLSYKEVVGPIDVERRAEFLRAQQLKDEFGTAKGRQMFQNEQRAALRSRALVVVISPRNGEVQRVVVPWGSTVSVEPLFEDDLEPNTKA